jgi:hypothetical protein
MSLWARVPRRIHGPHDGLCGAASSSRLVVLATRKEKKIVWLSATAPGTGRGNTRRCVDGSRNRRIFSYESPFLYGRGGTTSPTPGSVVRSVYGTAPDTRNCASTSAESRMTQVLNSRFAD